LVRKITFRAEQPLSAGSTVVTLSRTPYVSAKGRKGAARFRPLSYLGPNIFLGSTE
jgi:hypothetical protein